MRWDDLQILWAVGSSGSFTTAARHLGISHSTVSRRLRSLEAIHGIHLFRHRGQGIELTDIGQALFEAVGRMADEADIAVLRIGGVSPALRGNIRFATTGMMADVMMPRLPEFSVEHPGLTIELVIGEHMSSLSRNEVDIVLRRTNLPPDDYVGWKIASTQDAVFGHRGLCKNQDKGSALTELPWVTYADGWGDDWKNTNAPTAGVSARINTEYGVFHAIRNGVGIGFLAASIAASEPELRQLTPVLPELNLDTWILIHREKRRNTILRRFVDFLRRVVPEQLGV